MNPKRLSIDNYEGKRLSSLFFKPVGSIRCTVVVAHGFRGTKENGGRIYSLAAKLVGLGCALLAFDFAGSGESEGEFAGVTLSRQARDLRSVVDWTERKGLKPLVLIGRSFGGSTVLAEASSDDRVGGIALWSTPIFLRETFGAMMPEEYARLEKGWPVTVTDKAGEFNLNPEFAYDIQCHNMVEYLRGLKGRPVLIVHGLQDEIVRPENAEYIYKEAGPQAELHLVKGSDHRFLNSSAVREDLTVDWLQRHFL